MSEFDPNMNTNQPEPTRVTTTESGTVYEFPPGSSGTVEISGSLYYLNPSYFNEEDGVRPPVILFVPFTTSTGGEIFSEVDQSQANNGIEPDVVKDDPQTIPDTNTVTGSGTKGDVSTDPPVVPNPVVSPVFSLWITGFKQGYDRIHVSQVLANELNLLCGDIDQLITRIEEGNITKVMVGGSAEIFLIRGQLLYSDCDVEQIGVSMVGNPISAYPGIYDLTCTPGSFVTGKGDDLLNVLATFEIGSQDRNSQLISVLEEDPNTQAAIVIGQPSEILYVIMDQLYRKGVFPLMQDNNGNRIDSLSFSTSIISFTEANDGNDSVDNSTTEGTGSNGSNGEPGSSGENKEIVLQDENGNDITVTIESDLVRNYLSIPPVLYFMLPMSLISGKGMPSYTSIDPYDSAVQFTIDVRDPSNPWEGGYYVYARDGYEVTTRINNNFVISHSITKEGSPTFTRKLNDFPPASMLVRDYTDTNERNTYTILMYPGVVKVTNKDTGEVLLSVVGKHADKFIVEGVLENIVEFPFDIQVDPEFNFLNGTREIRTVLANSDIEIIRAQNTFLGSIFINDPTTNSFKSISTMMREVKQSNSLEMVIGMLITILPMINSSLEFARGYGLTEEEFSSWMSWVGHDLNSPEMRKALSYTSFMGFQYGSFTLDKLLMSPFYNPETDWYATEAKLESTNIRLFYKYATPGEFTLNERFVLDDPTKPDYNTQDILDSSSIQVHTGNGIEILTEKVNRDGFYEWRIYTEQPLTTDTLIYTILTSRKGTAPLQQNIAFFIKMEEPKLT